ncbi:MAG: tRNA (uridine(54)-C5)-methyltransferase TrmA [Campylobacterales bacterium]|nr:tRNA (uridine(54)-C5)-methyltransferase TrmA [Campylobacterales bacterium]
MTCEHFGTCGSCTLHHLGYEGQLEHKTQEAKALFAPFGGDAPEVFASKQTHYRNRAEFRVWHEGEALDFAMNSVEGGTVLIQTCPKADEAINALLPALKSALQATPMLREKLFGVEFLSAREEMLVTLIYHKKLGDAWEEAAKVLEEALHVRLIGRSRGVKKVLSEGWVEDALHVKEKTYRFKLLEGAFSQPNRSVNEQMIDWVRTKLDPFTCKDLLELYCGHGNFTLPLSAHFRSVLATEISKASIKAALENCTLNDVCNITFVRMSAEELTSALNKEREFVRLREVDLDGYDFSHLFVDPPRAGMDEKSCAFAAQFEHIIYISCNPHTLARDLEVLSQTHKVAHFALFDQFPYTYHLESGVVLVKK